MTASAHDSLALLVYANLYICLYKTLNGDSQKPLHAVSRNKDCPA